MYFLSHLNEHKFFEETTMNLVKVLYSFEYIYSSTVLLSLWRLPRLFK
jgi:hypothetical protein